MSPSNTTAAPVNREQEIAERFARDTAGHQMTVLHEDGLYRHLRFRNPRSSEFWFELITWPGCLTIRGDYGDAYTFARIPDMFEFFRSRSGRINPHYWAQKLDGHRQSAKTYSEDAFRQIVCELFVSAAQCEGVPAGTGKAVRAEILDQDLFDEGEARELLDTFEFGATFKASCTCGKSEVFSTDTQADRWRIEHIEPGHRAHVSKVTRVPGFSFGETWELTFTDYERDFLWACHAIVWGIARYDRVRRYGLQQLAAAKAVA